MKNLGCTLCTIQCCILELFCFCRLIRDLSGKKWVNCGLEIVLGDYVSSALLPTESLRKRSNGQSQALRWDTLIAKLFRRRGLRSLFVFKLLKVLLKQIWILWPCVLQIDPEAGTGLPTSSRTSPAPGGPGGRCVLPAEAVTARLGTREPQSCCPRGLVLKSLVRLLPEPPQRNPETWRQMGQRWQMDRSPRKLMLQSPMTSLKPWS